MRKNKLYVIIKVHQYPDVTEVFTDSIATFHSEANAKIKLDRLITDAEEYVQYYLITAKIS